MDWGLAKVLPRGGVVDDAQAGKLDRQETVIATARSGSGEAGLSHAGSVMGTPSYMAPEQARGEIDRVDERADVFALGSILCEILTGSPAFLGRSSGEILRKAALGDLADAFARLDACGADAELIAMARDCLAREPEDRPRDAGAVAERVTAYLARRAGAAAHAPSWPARPRPPAPRRPSAPPPRPTSAPGRTPAPAVPGRAGGLAAGAGHRGRARSDATRYSSASGRPRGLARCSPRPRRCAIRARRDAGDPVARGAMPWRRSSGPRAGGREVEVLRDEIQAGLKEAERGDPAAAGAG